MENPSADVRTVPVVKNINVSFHDILLALQNRNTAKCPETPGLPPSTIYSSLQKVSRQVDLIRSKAKQEMEQCSQDEQDRLKLLNEIEQKTENLKSIFCALGKSYDELENLKSEHLNIVNALEATITESDQSTQRYKKAGDDLTEILKIIVSAIQLNKCYQEFMDSECSDTSSSHLALIERYHRLADVNNNLTQQIDTIVKKIERTKRDIFQNIEGGKDELNNKWERLQTVDYILNIVASNNAKYELALNSMTTISVSESKVMNLTMRSVRAIIDRMIQKKEITEDIRNKTLAKQFDAIKDNYLKKKAILQEYNRSLSSKENTKSLRWNLYEKFDRSRGTTDLIEKRLNDMVLKKRMATIRKLQARRERLAKRIGGLTVLESEDEKIDEFNPLKCKRELVNLDEPEFPSQQSRKMSYDEDDDDYSEHYDGDPITEIFLVNVVDTEPFVERQGPKPEASTDGRSMYSKYTTLDVPS